MTSTQAINPGMVGDDRNQAAVHGPVLTPVPPGDAAELRRVILRAASLGVTKHAEMTYTEDSRRWSGITTNRRSIDGQVPPYSDCSSFATWCYWDASRWLNLQDIVNGEHWQAGYTGTMIQHGKAIAFDQAQPGDLVFYGDVDAPYHVAIFAGAGQVVSMGRPGAPELVGWAGASMVRTYI